VAPVLAAAPDELALPVEPPIPANALLLLEAPPAPVAAAALPAVVELAGCWNVSDGVCPAVPEFSSPLEHAAKPTTKKQLTNKPNVKIRIYMI
jgi:hypothetical protein